MCVRVIFFYFRQKIQKQFNLHELAIEDAHNAHQRPKIEMYGDTLFAVLRTAKINKETMHIDFGETHFFVGVNFNYASHTIAVDQLFEREAFFKGIKSYRDEHNTGYRIYDTRIGYQFSKITAQLNINNLTNEDYSIRPGLMEGPRNISARLTWKM